MHKSKAKWMIAILLVVLMALPMAFAADIALTFPELTETICEWDGEGNLIAETVKDLSGRPALNSKGYASARYTWDEQGNKLTEAYFDLNGNPADTVFGYARAEFTYFVDHREVSHVLTEDRYAADGSRADIPGSYSYRVDTWQGETILASEYFDASGNYTRPAGGYARVIYDHEYDGNYEIVTKRCYDVAGNILPGDEGGAAVVSTYTRSAYYIEEIETEDQAENIFPTDRDESIGDYQQLLLSREIFGADGSKVIGSSKWHKQVNTYDRAGNLTRTDYYDPDDEPILSREGYASVTHAYDAQDRVVETVYYGADGNMIKTITGYAKVTFEYYAQTGKIHYETYFGADGERTTTTQGYSKAEYEYDGSDYDVRITYYDTEDEYAMYMHGYARIEYLFARRSVRQDDGSERVVLSNDAVAQEKYFGVDMNLIQLKAGYAGIVNERNRYGQVIRTIYMNSDWLPARNDEFQYAEIRYTYAGTEIDEKPVHEEYFNMEGKPCENVNGYYARDMVWGGPRGELLLREAFLDQNGNADVSVDKGVSAVEYSYNGDRLQTSVRYFNQSGAPIAANNGYAACLREYGTGNHLLWEATLNTENQLVTVGSGCALRANAYDYAGRLMATKFFGNEGQPLMQSSGYASV